MSLPAVVPHVPEPFFPVCRRLSTFVGHSQGVHGARGTKRVRRVSEVLSPKPHPQTPAATSSHQGVDVSTAARKARKRAGVRFERVPKHRTRMHGTATLGLVSRAELLFGMLIRGTL